MVHAALHAHTVLMGKLRDHVLVHVCGRESSKNATRAGRDPPPQLFSNRSHETARTANNTGHGTNQRTRDTVRQSGQPGPGNFAREVKLRRWRPLPLRREGACQVTSTATRTRRRSA